MKKSKFNNLFTVDGDNFFIYNALSNSFLKVEENVFNVLKQDNINEELLSQEEIYELKSSNFLYENEEENDFLLEQMLLYNSRCNDKSVLNITIIPTLSCNFNCPYCYELTRPNIYITEETISNLIDFISKQDKIETLTIQWYGGEPLLAFDKMVDITNRIKDIPFIKKNNVTIISDITTNGYLLDEEKISKLDDLFVKTIQITIDGLEKTHNVRRPHLTKNDSFQKIINNLIQLNKLKPDIIVHIRSNIDNTNKEEFPELINYLNSKFDLNKNIKIYPGFVMDTGVPNHGNGCTLDVLNQLKFKIELFYKFKINLGYYPNNRDNICMAQHINSFVIDPEGYITKCWLDIGQKERAIANINSSEFLNHKLFTKYLVSCNPFYDSECTNCKIFPICGGGCQHDRIENKYFSTNHNLCSTYKFGLGQLLYTHYLSKKNEL